MPAKKTLFKIVLLGDAGVGKSCLMHQYVDQKFLTHYKATLGADFMAKDLTVDGKQCTLQIWDTAGQERFQSLGLAFYRGADCCILVYDVSVPRSFRSLDSWRDEFLIQGNLRDPDNFPFVVIGNKIDTEDKVTVARAEEWVKTRGNMSFFQASAKDALNVDEAFTAVAQLALNKQLTDEELFSDKSNRISLQHGDYKNKNSINSNGEQCGC